MKIIRSVNGVEISEEDFKKLDLTNPTLEKIFVNDSRFSNIFIEKRELSFLESLANAGFFFFNPLHQISEISKIQNLFFNKRTLYGQFYRKTASYASSYSCGVLYFKVLWGRTSL